MAALGQAQAQESIEPKEADHKLIPYGKEKRQVLHHNSLNITVRSHDLIYGIGFSGGKG